MNARSGSTTVGPETTRIAPIRTATPLLIPATSNADSRRDAGAGNDDADDDEAHDHPVRSERHLGEREPQPRLEQDDADCERYEWLVEISEQVLEG